MIQGYLIPYIRQSKNFNIQITVRQVTAAVLKQLPTVYAAGKTAIKYYTALYVCYSTVSVLFYFAYVSIKPHLISTVPPLCSVKFFDSVMGSLFIFVLFPFSCKTKKCCLSSKSNYGVLNIILGQEL